MTVVKARDLKKEQRGIVFDFKDIAAEAKDMLESAKAECKRLREEADKEIAQKREKVYKEAYDKGYELGQKKGYDDAYGPAEKKGYDDGHAKALEEIKQRFEMHIDEPLADTKKIIEYFDSNKTRLLWEAEQSFVVLAIKLAEKVVRREIELRPEIISETVRGALETVARTTNVVIKVSPEDISIIEDLKGSLSDILGRFSSVTITPDETISRGGCVVLTERGRVDARIETQIDRIARDILEPGACLEIEEQEESLPVDKLIGETSQQEQEPEAIEEVIEETEKELPQEAVVQEQPELEVEEPVEEAVTEMPESAEDVSQELEPETPIDQAESLRQQMKEQSDPQDES